MNQITNIPQGDVNFFPVTETTHKLFQPPADLVAVPGANILALGESTGHMHTIVATEGEYEVMASADEVKALLKPEDAIDLERRWLKLLGRVEIHHVKDGHPTGDHDVIVLDPEVLGTDMVMIAPRWEYTPAGARRVED